MVCVIDQTWYMPSKSKLECKLYDEQKCTVRQSPNRCDWEGFFFLGGGGPRSSVGFVDVWQSG